MIKDKKLYYLTDHLIKTINLPDFIEDVADVTLKWRRGGTDRASCHCPMPNHNDRNASFHIHQTTDGVWIYHCFGCGSKGHIIHFCMDYYGLRNKLESILFICKKFGIKDKEDLILQGLKNVSKRVDLQRRMENSHVMVSNQCRLLLRKSYELHSKWVLNAYRRLNKALEKENCDEIESIGYEASNRTNSELLEGIA